MIQTDRLSADAITRIDELKAKADAKFNFDWLHKQLWDELQKNMKNKNCHQFCDGMQQDKEQLFVWLFVSSHRSSLSEVRELHDTLFPDQDFGLELLEERNRLIEEFGEMHLSMRWKHVFNDKEGKTWRLFAKSLHYENPEDLAKIKRFLYLLDKIQIITDLLCKRERGYDMSVNLVQYKRARVGAGKGNKENEPPRALLLKAIEACKDLFWAQTAWAVVYVLCREDYGIDDNKAMFERYAQDLLKEPELKDMEKGCPNGTIQSAEEGNGGSDSFLHEPSSTWSICRAPRRAIELMTSLRNKISDLEKEEKGEQLKQMYKNSERGF